MLRTQKITVLIAGAATSGSANSKYAVSGLVYGVYVKYTTQPGTCIVTISGLGSDAPGYQLLRLAAANTDGWFFPKTTTVKNDGTAITAWYDEPPINDHVKVDVASGAAGQVDVWVLYADDE